MLHKHKRSDIRKPSFPRSYAYVYTAPRLHSCKHDVNISISIIKWTRYMSLMIGLVQNKTFKVDMKAFQKHT